MNARMRRPHAAARAAGPGPSADTSGTAARPAPARNRALAARSAAGYSPGGSGLPLGVHRREPIAVILWADPAANNGTLVQWEYERRAGKGFQVRPRRPAHPVAGADGRARLLPRGASRPRLYAPAAPDLHAVAAERAADGGAAADAGALVVVAACRRAAGAPARRAAERRAARDGARLVCKQLQRGADRRGAGARLRARAAAPGFAAQRRHLPPLRRARRAARLFVPRRGPGEADRLRRGRVLDAGAHALLVQRAGRADGGAAGADLGHLPARATCATRRRGATSRSQRCSSACWRPAWWSSTCRCSTPTPRRRCSTRRCRSCCGPRCAWAPPAPRARSR